VETSPLRARNHDLKNSMTKIYASMMYGWLLAAGRVAFADDMSMSAIEKNRMKRSAPV